ncbi:MAG: hypothetical protein AB7S26_01385 [Sandaracinaceae bacterium]
MNRHRRLLSAVLVIAALALASAAAAQVSVLFRVRIPAPPNPTTAPVAVVQPFNPPSWSLRDRAAIQAMWELMQSDLTSMARECRMPVGVEIDAQSFAGRLVVGTQDGLHPGTRSRFNDLNRALVAMCHRGDMERGAMQQRVHGVRYGFTDASTDSIAIEGDTLVFRTNGDLVGDGHITYGGFLSWLEGAL